MEQVIKSIVNSYVNDLVHYIIKKHPNVDKNLIHQKIKELNIIKDGNKSLMQQLLEAKPVIMVEKTNFSNYVVKGSVLTTDLNDAKLVLNLATKTIVGSENTIGEVVLLNVELVDLCNKYKLKYEMPLNLNENDKEDSLEEAHSLASRVENLGLNYAESEEEIEDEIS